MSSNCRKAHDKLRRAYENCTGTRLTAEEVEAMIRCDDALRKAVFDEEAEEQARERSGKEGV